MYSRITIVVRLRSGKQFGKWQDAMGWNGLSGGRQREALVDAPQWIAAVATVVPGTSEEVIRWLAVDGTDFVRGCIRDNVTMSDDVRALAVFAG